MILNLERLIQSKKLRSTTTYGYEPSVGLRPPTLPGKNDANSTPQRVEPFVQDGVSCIDLDLLPRGPRRFELTVISKLETDGVLPNYTVDGEPLTPKSDRLRDASGNKQVAALIESQDHAELAKLHPASILHGYWATRGPEKTNCSTPKAVTISTVMRDIVPKTIHYARKAGDASQKISDERRVYMPTLKTEIVRTAICNLGLIAKRLVPTSDIFRLVATVSVLELLAAEEGLPGRSGNYELVSCPNGSCHKLEACAAVVRCA